MRTTLKAEWERSSAFRVGTTSVKTVACSVGTTHKDWVVQTHAVDQEPTPFTKDPRLYQGLTTTGPGMLTKTNVESAKHMRVIRRTCAHAKMQAWHETAIKAWKEMRVA